MCELEPHVTYPYTKIILFLDKSYDAGDFSLCNIFFFLEEEQALIFGRLGGWGSRPNKTFHNNKLVQSIYHRYLSERCFKFSLSNIFPRNNL